MLIKVVNRVDQNSVMRAPRKRSFTKSVIPPFSKLKYTVSFSKFPMYRYYYRYAYNRCKPYGRE